MLFPRHTHSLREREVDLERERVTSPPRAQIDKPSRSLAHISQIVASQSDPDIRAHTLALFAIEVLIITLGAPGRRYCGVPLSSASLQSAPKGATRVHRLTLTLWC